MTFFSSALGNHQRKGDESAVCYALAAVRIIENVVIVKEPEEQRSSYALIAIAEEWFLVTR